MNKDFKADNDKLETEDAKICNTLASVIDEVLPEAENKIRHAHPVWFLDGNPRRFRQSRVHELDRTFRRCLVGLQKHS